MIPENEQIKIKSQPKYDINVDRTKRANLFSPPFCFNMYANTRGGKSHLIKEVLLNPIYNVIDNYILPENIYICSPTAIDDDTYEELLTKLRSYKQFDEQKQIIEDPTKIDGFIRNVIIENKKLKRQQIYKYPLFIIDDCLGDCDMSNRSAFAQVAAKGRHHLVSQILTTQSHKGIGNIIRRNATHNAIWELQDGDEVDSVVKQMRGVLKPSIFKQLYIDAYKEQDHGFLFHCSLLPSQLKFSFSMQKMVEM